MHTVKFAIAFLLHKNRVTHSSFSKRVKEGESPKTIAGSLTKVHLILTNCTDNVINNHCWCYQVCLVKAFLSSPQFEVYLWANHRDQRSPYTPGITALATEDRDGYTVTYQVTLQGIRTSFCHPWAGGHTTLFSHGSVKSTGTWVAKRQRRSVKEPVVIQNQL